MGSQYACRSPTLTYTASATPILTLPPEQVKSDDNASECNHLTN